MVAARFLLKLGNLSSETATSAEEAAVFALPESVAGADAVDTVAGAVAVAVGAEWMDVDTVQDPVPVDGSDNYHHLGVNGYYKLML